MNTQNPELPKGLRFTFDVSREDFGKRLRTLRKQGGLTRKELGRLAGVDSELIRSYESGKALPKAKTLLSLASVFSVTIEWLLIGEDEPSGVD